MKKIFNFLFISMLFISMAVFLIGCSHQDNEDYSERVTLEVGRINVSDATKTIDITYPIIGGLDRSDHINMINSSITNYIERQQTEFENALVDVSHSDTPINQEILGEDVNAYAPEEERAENESDQEANPKEAAPEPSAEQSGEQGDSSSISLTMRFDITYNQNNILNILESFEKDLGSDNEVISGQHSFIFDLSRGVPLTLGELFDFDGDFPSTINNGIKEQIKADSSLVTFEDQQGFSGISKDANYYTDGENIYIFYNALEIGPDKNLVPVFTFSLKELEPFLMDEYTDSFN